ncbi:unnamed protein product [Somion occarium]|uniref:Uncharacterized protein n=1 Tax=Somion occarium TaxID=3059160 RepID=A0ABP1CUD4_9APHY
MRPTILLLFALGASTAQASWFSSAKRTETSPSAWSSEQLAKAQALFQGLKVDAFDTWDESRLREFLLEQGVVAPSGTREQLVLLAKQKYNLYSSAASSYSASASSLASQASDTAYTALYGDSKSQASKSVSSYVAQATSDASRKLDDSKDYVYSTWDDNRLRKYLEDKGVIKTKQQATRDELLEKMRETYSQTTNPIWKAWSDSYIHEWLVSHGILHPDEHKPRDQLVSDMKKYYYDNKLKDTVYTSWSDSQIHKWLIDHGIIKTDAQVEREKLEKLIADHYANAKDTIWSSWKDSDMRDWLIANGYLKSDVQKTREELVDLMESKYNDASTRTAAYLVWPDARLRAYLREHGISDAALPTSRPGLLQEVRIRWVQTTTRAEALFATIREVITSGVEAAEEKLGTVRSRRLHFRLLFNICYPQILDILTGHVESAKTRANEAQDATKDYVNEKYAEGKDYAGQKAGEAKAKAGDTYEYASDKTAEAKGKAGAKSAEYSSAGKKYWNEKVEAAKKKADQAKVEL